MKKQHFFELTAKQIAKNSSRRESTHRLHLSRGILLVSCSFLILACSSILAQTVKPENVSADCRVRAYGAKGDGVTLDTVAINAAVQDCHSRGGGTVVMEAGTYRTGTIRLLDNIT